MLNLFYKGKHIAKSDQKYINHALPLLLGLLVCMMCLAGTTWAWFTMNIQTPAQVIQSAEYSVSVQVSGTEGVIPSDAQSDDYMISYSESLVGNETYSVTIIPTGTAQTGYCVLALNGDFYYTNTIPRAGLTFTYQTGISDQTITTATEYDTALANWTGDLLIAWYWGKYPHTQDGSTYAMNNITLLSDGDTVGIALATRPTETATLELNLTNLTADVSAGEIATNTDLTVTLTAAEGYTLPENVTVEGVTYTYENGVITILADQIKDGTAITITAEAFKIATETTATDSNATSSDSNATEPSEGISEPSTDPTTSPTGESTPTANEGTPDDSTVSSGDATTPGEETSSETLTSSSSDAEESNAEETETSNQAESDNSSSDE